MHGENELIDECGILSDDGCVNNEVFQSCYLLHELLFTFCDFSKDLSSFNFPRKPSGAISVRQRVLIRQFERECFSSQSAVGSIETSTDAREVSPCLCAPPNGSLWYCSWSDPPTQASRQVSFDGAPRRVGPVGLQLESSSQRPCLGVLLVALVWSARVVANFKGPKSPGTTRDEEKVTFFEQQLNGIHYVLSKFRTLGHQRTRDEATAVTFKVACSGDEKHG